MSGHAFVREERRRVGFRRDARAARRSADREIRGLTRVQRLVLKDWYCRSGWADGQLGVIVCGPIEQRRGCAVEVPSKERE
jgi:hypothetical protein